MTLTVPIVDPGGEPYFSLGMAAPGWWATSSGCQLTNNAPVGRTTQYAIQMNSGGSSATMEKNLPANYTRYVLGGAYWVPSNWLNTTMILGMMDGANLQCEVRIDTSGKLYFARNNTVISSLSSLALVANQGWVYIELDATIDNTTGAMQVWVNGVSYLSATGLDTQNTANAFTNRVRFSAVTNNTVSYWKDMYGVDTGTGDNTSRLGDVAIDVLYPNSAGPSQDYTANGAGTQVGCIQDGITHTGTWPDGDTTYISDATSGHISDFGHQTLTLTGTIYGIIQASYARKDDAGARNFNQYLKSGSATNISPNISLGNSYIYYLRAIERDPNTNAQWGVTGFNAATMGPMTT